MSHNTDQQPDFEQALMELESLVSKLESGELGLDQSLEYFKRGVELTRHCQSVLDQAQQTVELLTLPDAAADEQASVEEPE
jgi:exodeoxyribonuclease VII small subunit